MFSPAASGLAEQAGRADQQDDDHDHEDDHAGGFRVEHLGHALDQPQPEPGQDRAHDRAHAADDDDGEDDDDQVGAHQRIDLEDWRRQHASEGGQSDAVAVGDGDQQRHVDAQGLDHLRIFGAGAQVGAELGPFDHVPGAETDGQRGDDDPATIDGQEHEAEIDAAGQRLRYLVAFAGNAELVPEDALDDQRQAEGQQQAVEVVELVESAQHQAFDQHPDDADDQRRGDQRHPVVDAEAGQRDPGDKGPHHVLRTMAEIDDVQQAEDDRQPEAENGVERAVDQPNQQLAAQQRGRDSENFHEGLRPRRKPLFAPGIAMRLTS